MPDPIRIEEAFHETTEAIKTAQSFRYIFTRFFAFTSLLEGEYLKYQSYLIQLFSDLPLYSLPVTWSGLDPQKLEADANSLETISSEIGTNACEDVVIRLREIAFLQYVCICEPEKADMQFKMLSNYRLLEEKGEHVKGTTCSNLSYVQQGLMRCSEQSGLSKSVQRTVNRLLTDIRRMLSREGNSMLIPVVEDASSGIHSNQPQRFGRLRRIRLMSSGKNDGKDRILRHYPVTGAEPVSNLERFEITLWGRKKVEEKNPNMKGRFFSASLHYDINDAGHRGESGSMAVSAMWHTFLLEKADLRERYTLAGDAAMSGDINVKGEVLPVDSEGIEHKTEAVFFSWANLLAVPARQLQEFDRCLKKLKRRYPDRTLTLIGIENLDGIFYDRRLSQYIVESRIKHSLKKFKKEKFKVVGIPLIVILLLIIARLIYGPVDKNPVFITFVDNFIEVKNSDGFTLKRLPTRNYNDIGAYRSEQAVLHDVDNDFYQDLIYDYNNEDVNNGNPVLRAWSSSGDSLLWQSEINLNYNYPRQLIPDFTNLRVIDIDLGYSADGPRVVVNARSTQYFQGMILIFDATSGELLSEYLNAGIITDILITDRNHDDISEVVFVGINNAYWNAFFAEINIDEGHGYSPATTDYIPDGIQKADEELYALLPKSLVAGYLTPIDKYNFARDVRYDSQKSEYLAIVREGRRYFDGDSFEVDILFHFSHAFKPTGIGTSDIYDVAARDFFKEGKIPFEPDYDYFEALQDSIQYWDGEKFVFTNEYFSD